MFKPVGTDRLKDQESGLRPQRVLKSIALLVVLGLAVHLLLPQLTELTHSIQVLQGLRIGVLGVALVAQLLSYAGSGLLFQAVVELTAVRITLLRSVAITLASASVGLVAGGLVGASAGVFTWMRGEGDNDHLSAALLASLLPPLINNLFLVGLSVFGLLQLLVLHQLTPFQVLSFGLMALVSSGLLLAVVWIARHRSQAARLLELLARKSAALVRQPYHDGQASAWLGQLLEAAEVLRVHGWQKTALGAVGNGIFDMLTLYCLFLAAGSPLPVRVLLVGYGIPLLLGKMAFVLPGGVGVVEASMVALYTSLGVTNAVAVVVVLVYRLISFWLPTLLGFPLAVYLERSAVEGQRRGTAGKKVG